jgi:hypothetical protein
VFTCIARFAPQKAHDVLLRAFDRARASTRASSCSWSATTRSATGAQRAEALARDLGLGATCVFAGIRRDVPRILAASDVFVMCSLWEGLGLVFLEAMAAQVPVLATRVSAVPEVVVDGSTGILVPPADEAALSDAMLRLAATPSCAAAWVARDRPACSARFGLERMFDETLAVYAEVVGGRPREGPRGNRSRGPSDAGRGRAVNAPNSETDSSAGPPSGRCRASREVHARSPPDETAVMSTPKPGAGGAVPRTRPPSAQDPAHLTLRAVGRAGAGARDVEARPKAASWTSTRRGSWPRSCGSR